MAATLAGRIHAETQLLTNNAELAVKIVLVNGTK
jgi:hypothetical protein